jgi:exodeoxyribonuclease VII small subunit
MTTPNKPTYNDAMSRLQEITAALEAGTVQIDDLDALLSESRELIRLCEEKLRSIDQKIDNLNDH